ncbi:unnamed protein product [Fusarium equiseti]|uniref:NACHT domain-containing protein n=1 Tax=Fusarium equiseti TaxID=61235 RepID=A0A8J2JDP5_FUSEQ|nr:unnamed protein product [Fusarium equiseti]
MQNLSPQYILRFSQQDSKFMMQKSTWNFVQTLSATDASRVHIGNTYNTTHTYYREPEQEKAQKLLEALYDTDPRHEKVRIEETNGYLLKESYVWILETTEFLAWRNKDHESRLLWIKGDPGKGKTMLLCGIIDQLLSSTRLNNPESPISLSYFFCQATDSRLSNLRALLRGLIYLLVIQQPWLASHLLDMKNEGTADWNSRAAVADLFRRIVADPALQETYLIVDALDECLQDFYPLLEIISSSTPHVKWIVSSRNRSEIERQFARSSTLGLSLELYGESVSQAVRCLIDYRTRQLVNTKRLKNDLEQKVYRHLTQHAHGTFLWVALVCQRLERCHVWEISKQLLEFPQGLNNLYTRMMDHIEASSSCELYIRLLAVASTVFRPLTFAEIMAMEPLESQISDEETLSNFVWECGSFLTRREKSIVFVHQSAKEFLLREKRARKLLFQSGLIHHHMDLFQRSIHLLKSLHRDIYNLVYPGVSLNSALCNRPNPDPLDSLAYAVVYWADHLQEVHRLSILGGTEERIPFVETIHNFFFKTFLFWLEALSLCQNLPVAGKALSFLKDLPTVLSQPIVTTLIEDALRFLLLVSPVIENHPLQIYASGLLFSPRKSLIRHMFEQYTPEFISRAPQVEDTWSPILTVFETSPETRIRTMSFSVTNAMLAVTTFDSQLSIWNVSDGSIHKRSNYDNAALLTISPNLQWLAVIIMRYCSDAEKHVQDAIEVRELDSNKAIWTRRFNGRKALAIQISPDSRWLAVGYNDELHVYDGEDGTPRSWPWQLDLDKQPSYLRPWRMKFSLDCAFLLLLYCDNVDTVLVADLFTGIQYKVPALDYHDGDSYGSCGMENVNDASFVPNTHTVMVCNGEGCIYMWDFLKGDCKEWVTNESYFDYVNCLSYSHAGSWIANATHEEVVLLRRDQRTLLRALQLPGAEWLTAIEASFDDKKLAVCSKSTVWILDVDIMIGAKQSSDEHEEEYPQILNDGVSIAYYDLRRTIKIENPMEGAITTLDIRNSVDGHINAIALSPEGRLLAYSDQSSIHIQDLDRESLRYSFKVHAEANNIAISSGINGVGQLVAVCMSFGVGVWDVDIGKFQRLIESPDNLGRHPTRAFFTGTQLVVSWYFDIFKDPDTLKDEILVLYDIRTGQQLTQLDLPRSSHMFDSEGGNFSISPNGKWVWQNTNSKDGSPSHSGATFNHPNF